MTSTPTGGTPSPTPTQTLEPDYDLDQSGSVDIGDLLLFMNYAKGQYNKEADFNNDGRIDSQDLFLLSQHWGQAMAP